MEKDYLNDFSSFGEKIWLNAASEGPLLKASGESLKEAVYWKSLPYLLDKPKFSDIPNSLKNSIGELIGVEGSDVILGNSASYGIHILANGFPWQQGDEILLMQNDFPSDILPWLALEKIGVNVNQIPAKEHVLTPEELLVYVTDKTKMVCLPHVHTFSGYTLDIKRIGAICQNNGIIFITNISQSVGTMHFNISELPIDAIVAAGYKWLCGPYGTGFCWIKPELREILELNHVFWASTLSKEDLKSTGPLTLKQDNTAQKFDIFGTANFFNFVPFKTAIDYWLNIGCENVAIYHRKLIDLLIAKLDGSAYEIISPKKGSQRSSLVLISHKDKEKNSRIFADLMSKGIYTAFWKGNIRIAPHVYNTTDDIDKLVNELEKE